MPSWEDLYFGALGVGLLLAGAVEVLVGISGNELSIAFVSVGGTFLLWRGIIVLSAGAFFLRSAVNGIETPRDQGVVVLGAII